jgi:tetratricopeptide (TPR) repeat protein
VAARIGRVHFFRGTAEEGLGRIESLLNRLDQEDVTPTLATLDAVLAMLTSLTDRGLAVAERAAERARKVGDDTLLLEVDAWRSYGLFSAGRHEEGGQVLEDVLARADAMGAFGTVCRGLGLMGRLYVLRGDFDRSGVYFQREMELAERMGDPEAVAWALNSTGFALFFSGDWERARDYLERAVDMTRSVQSHWSPYPLIDLAKLALAEGKGEEASRLLEEAKAMAERTGDRHQMVHVQTLLAKRDMLEGRPDAALSRLEDSADGPLWMKENVTELLPVLAEVYLALGNVARAEEVARESMRRASERHHCLALVDALRVYGMVVTKGRRWKEAANAFQEAVHLVRRMPYPYAEACTLYEWGLMTTRKGELDEARERLEEAHTIFGRLRAQPYLERAQRALAQLDAIELA